MKGLIHCRPSRSGFARDFRARTPYLLPICNKILLEYELDLFHHLGAREIWLVVHDEVGDIELTFQSGARFGLAIHYVNAKPGDTLAQALASVPELVGEDVLAADGCIFPHFDKRRLGRLDGLVEDAVTLLGDGQGLEDNVSFLPGSLTAEPGKLAGAKVVRLPEPVARIQPVESVKQYFDLNLETLARGSAVSELPGYSTEEGAYIGMNVVLTPRSRVEKPVMIGSNSQVGKGSVLAGNVVLGWHVIVGANTTLKDAVVLERTYVGDGLEIVRKIVDGRRVIDPERGIAVDIVEGFLIGELGKVRGGGLVRRALGFFLVLPLLAFQLPFYLLLRSRVERHAVRYFVDKDGRKIAAAHYGERRSGGAAETIFFKLSLDRVPLLARVLTGDVAFAGNRPALATPEGLRAVRELPVYSPGAFWYSDFFGSGAEREEVEERLYSRNRTLWMDLRIFIGALRARLL